jgi:hypothetical protein
VCNNRKYVAILSNFVFSLAVRFNLIQPWSSIDIESSGGGGGSSLNASTSSTTTQGGATYTSVPGGARAEAERRRAMALEALDRRMASKPTTNATGPSTTGGAGVVPSPVATPEPTDSKNTEGPGVTTESTTDAKV